MNTKNYIFLSMAILTMSLLAGCGIQGPNYTITSYGQDTNFNVVTMKTYDPASEEFTFRYDKNDWTLEEWPEEKAPNIVTLVHKSSDDRYKCLVFPGTIGAGLGEGNQAIEGSLLTERYVGRTIDIYNPIGIHLIHVVGYEIGDMPYIFETRIPSRDPETCEFASQAVVSSFNVQNYEEPPVEESVKEVQGTVEVTAAESLEKDAEDTTSNMENIVVEKVE